MRITMPARIKVKSHITSRKRAVNLTLNAELVDRARLLVPSLSSAVETLLTDFVAREEVRQADREEALARTLKFWNDFSAREGSIADEHSTL
jgi:antitoxin CcdA